MATPSPLRDYYEQIDALLMPFGEMAEVVAEVEQTEIEYAAIRKAVGLLDGSHRGLLRLTGGDRTDFLHRLLTGDCRELAAGDVRRMFLLNTKGRIMGDLLVVQGDGQTLLDLDVHQVKTIAEELDKLLFGEDVQIEDLSESHHRVSLHGPRAREIADWYENEFPAEGGGWWFRYDQTDSPGWHLWTVKEQALPFAEHAPTLADRFGLKHIGWMAFNIARIEAGRPIFNIDFGTDTLPHEVGRDLLEEAVSFTAGCYRGQEVVARMESRGHPAKVLVGFELEGAHAPGSDAARQPPIPVGGAPLLDTSGDEPKTVGAVTSSTYSPRRSHLPIGIAMVKWSRHEPGTQLRIPIEGRNVPAVVRPLRQMLTPQPTS